MNDGQKSSARVASDRTDRLFLSAEAARIRGSRRNVEATEVLRRDDRPDSASSQEQRLICWAAENGCLYDNYPTQHVFFASGIRTNWYLDL